MNISITHILAETELGRLKLAYAWLVSEKLMMPEIMIPSKTGKEWFITFGRDNGYTTPSFPQFCEAFYDSGEAISGVAALDEDDDDRISFLLMPDRMGAGMPEKSKFIINFMEDDEVTVSTICSDLIRIAMNVNE